MHVFGFRVRDRDGRLAGTAMMTKPAAGMAILGSITSMGDARHYQRMLQVAKAGRRPAAILFADLEGSSPLSRRLSTASYFALGRRLVRASDAAVVEAGGIPGRHVGDGTVAFFLTETCGSESAAARACVTAARSLRTALDGVAQRSGLEPQDVVLRFGLHWGSTLYVGSITTGARSEVTALGDEVNEAARIEACASGGRMLASKSLMERLEPDDAEALGLDPDRITYTALGDLDTRDREGAARRTGDRGVRGMSAVDDHLAEVPPDQRAALEHLRATIRAAAPDATEAISYGMPAFKQDGRRPRRLRRVQGALQPLPDERGGHRRRSRTNVAGFTTSKGTIRFTTDAPLPDALVTRIVQARLAELAARG